MEYSIQELIRETKNAINTRLDMLESLISTKKVCTIDINGESLNESLYERISILETIVKDLQKEDIPEVVIIEKDTHEDEPIIERSQEIQEVQNVQVDEAQEDAAQEADDEGDEAEEGEGEGEGEGEAIALTEFTYKGMTLYHDEEYKVYQMGEDGELSDPIGIWDESKNRIKKLS